MKCEIILLLSFAALQTWANEIELLKYIQNPEPQINLKPRQTTVCKRRGN